MDPEHLLSNDRSLFEAELEGMIADAAASIRSTSAEASASPDVNHRKRSIAWESEAASLALKRRRTDSQEQKLPLRIIKSAKSDHRDIVHRSRASFFNRSDDSPVQNPRRESSSVHGFVPTFPDLEGQRSSHPTEVTSRQAIHGQCDVQKVDQEHEELPELRLREGMKYSDRYVLDAGFSSYHDHASLPNKLASRSQDRKAARLRRFSFYELPPKIRDRIYELLLTKDGPI
ncbi:hypothetical protein KC360_g1831 [Hortaea werneckii]|nr:hypothetical protein KC325_g1311 [Hortaea werneckii]KAI6997379.1 hypothetical protein KC359_g2980 [Hortaea werneckii]KAI7148189.1 hypothetical protein KC344_g2131 [Hortaea werneckii]KAI7178068.1 hypothetical protein KC360_g1831 [Hortaea werneckii]